MRIVEAEAGQMLCPVAKELVSHLNSHEHLWDRNFLKLIEAVNIEITDRPATDFLNMTLHRSGEASLKLRTVTDLCTREGEEAQNWMRAYLMNVLASNGITVLSEGDIRIQFTEGFDPSQWDWKGIPEDQKESFGNQILFQVQEYNSRKKDGIGIAPDHLDFQLYYNQDGTKICHIHLDGILSKMQKKNNRSKKGSHKRNQRKCRKDKMRQIGQKARKAVEQGDPVPTEAEIMPSYVGAEETIGTPTVDDKAPASKKRPSVSTDLARISLPDGSEYTLVGTDMDEVVVMTLAFLIMHDALADTKLVFHSDGAKDIKAALERYFGWRSYSVVIDWFHLRKHCYELLSMTLHGGKTKRNMQYLVRRTLYRYLWCGDYDGAKKYLMTLTNAEVKNQNRLQELLDYLDRKSYALASYALLEINGLPLSSNPVEKANDIIVARRQKKQGSAWSNRGSHAYAMLTSLFVNYEINHWYETSTLSFKPFFRTPESPDWRDWRSYCGAVAA